MTVAARWIDDRGAAVLCAVNVATPQVSVQQRGAFVVACSQLIGCMREQVFHASAMRDAEPVDLRKDALIAPECCPIVRPRVRLRQGPDVVGCLPAKLRVLMAMHFCELATQLVPG